MTAKRSLGPSVLVVLALAGCSSVPDAVNPMEWYRSATGSSSSRPAAQTNPTDTRMAEAQSKSAPNLATVPERPTRASTPAERQALTQGLVADRENAKYTDDDLQPRTAQASAPAARPATPPAPPVTTPPAPAAAAPASPPPPAVAAASPPSAPPTPPAARAASPAPAPPAATAQPVPPPPPPAMPQVASPPPRAAAPAAPSAPPPSPAPARAAAPPPPVAAAPPPAARPQAPAAAQATTVDQIYRQQLARSESAVQLRQPAAEPPPPPPAQPRRIGALQHTARETSRSQVAYVGGTTGVPSTTIQPGEPAATIRFSEGTARLAATDRTTLARIAAMAQELGGRVRVVGHAGRPGGEGAKSEVSDFNLSLDRANAVAQELMRNGISSERLKIEAVGDAEPLVIAGSAGAEAANRRAEVFIE